MRWLALSCCGFVPILLLLSILGIPGTANAVPVNFHMEGIVTSSKDTFNTLGFGAGEGVLDGQEIKVSLLYLTDLAPPNTSMDPSVGFYSETLETNTGGLWMSIPDIVIGGVPLIIPPLPHPPTSLDSDQIMTVVPDANSVTVSRDLDYEQDVFFVDYGIDNTTATFRDIDTIDIPVLLPGSDFLSGQGTVFLDANDSEGNLFGDVFARFDMTSARITPVPEPSTLFVLGTGLVGLVARTRWRR